MTEDARRDYGERRFVAVGKAEGLTLTVVYTDRDVDGEIVRRIISVRLSSPKERERYAKALAQEDGLSRGEC